MIDKRFIKSSIELHKTIYKDAIEPIFNRYYPVCDHYFNRYFNTITKTNPNPQYLKTNERFNRWIVREACRTLCSLLNNSNQVYKDFDTDHYNPSVLNDIVNIQFNKFRQLVVTINREKFQRD